MARAIIGFWMCLMASTVLADTMADGKALAESMTSTIKQSATTDQNMPAMYQGAQVPETALYDNGANLENEALDKVATDPAAQELYLQNANRPRIVMDPRTDPTLVNARLINQQATEFMQGGFNGCVTLGSFGTKTVTSTQHCTVSGFQEAVDFTCSDTVSARCSNSDAGKDMPMPFSQIRLLSSDRGVSLRDARHGEWEIYTGTRTQNCRGFYKDVFSITVPEGYEIASFMYSPRMWDDWVLLKLNDRVREGAASSAWWTHALIGGKTDVLDLGTPTCEQNERDSHSYRFDLLPYANTGSGAVNRLEVYHRVGGSGDYRLQFNIRLRRRCEVAFTTEHACTQGQTDEALDKQALGEPYCSDAEPANRAIPGTVFNTTRTCWQTTQAWRTWKAPVYVEDGTCAGYRQRGCQQVDSGQCLTMHERGYCQLAELSFECGTSAAGGTTELCSTELACQGGECTEEYNQPYDATQDFQQAIATLTMVDEAAVSLDEDSMSIWQGKALTCKRSDFDVKDCCKDEGWGLDLGLSSCSNSEQELGEAREAMKAIYVGSEDGGSWPSEWTKYKYCVYPTKLARIVMRQAIPMLGESFGSYNRPNCRGLLLREFASLDFSRIDLSEYFADVMQKANLALEDMPSSEELLQRLQQNMEALQE